jgi:protein TonB
MLERLRKLGWATFALVLLVGVVVLVTQMLRGGSTPQQRPVTTVMRVILPPPPPPPPPPPQPQKMIEPPKPTQQEAAKPVQQPKQAPPKTPSAVPKPPGSPLTAPEGAGPNQYGLGVGNGEGVMIGGGGGGGGGSREAYYSNLVSMALTRALQENEQTRFMRFPDILIGVWLAPSGQVTRVKLVRSTGDSAKDEILRTVLATASLREAWPPDEALPVYIHSDVQK